MLIEYCALWKVRPIILLISAKTFNKRGRKCGQKVGPGYKRPNRIQYFRGLNHTIDRLMCFVLI